MRGRKRHGGRRAGRGTPPVFHDPANRKEWRRSRAAWPAATFAGHRFPYARVEFAIVNAVSATADAFIAEFGAMLDNLTPETEHRIRCDMRYDREIADARARNMPDTAAAIETERAEWLATLAATAND